MSCSRKRIFQRLILLVSFVAGEQVLADPLYIPTSTVIDAQTGSATLNGPDNYQTLGSQTGSYTANSIYSYFSEWSQSAVNSSATATASLSDAGITLTATNSTDGYGYNFTSGVASAIVDFTLPNGEWIMLNNSDTQAEDGQVSCLLTGPDGWTAPYGTLISAPPGDYSFSISANIARTAGIDSPSYENASLQIVPEPVLAAAVAIFGFARRRMNHR